MLLVTHPLESRVVRKLTVLLVVFKILYILYMDCVWMNYHVRDFKMLLLIPITLLTNQKKQASKVFR